MAPHGPVGASRTDLLRETLLHIAVLNPSFTIGHWRPQFGREGDPTCQRLRRGIGWAFVSQILMRCLSSGRH
jgi:hypothetical protein